MIATLNTNLMGIINQVLNRPSHSRVSWFSLVGEDYSMLAMFVVYFR